MFGASYSYTNSQPSSQRPSTETKQNHLKHTHTREKNDSVGNGDFDSDDDWDAHVRIEKPPSIPKPAPPTESSNLDPTATKEAKFSRILDVPNSIDMVSLRKLAWSGIPAHYRSLVWKLLFSYLSPNTNLHASSLERKRKEYVDAINLSFKTEKDQQTWHQIVIDVRRTNPHIRLYSYETTQRSLERILYLWAIRHPASGYVQGINDIATPIFQTFLSSYIPPNTIGDLMVVELFDPEKLTKTELDSLEADTFWCLSKLLDSIQDNYIHAQPGIISQITALHSLTKKIDPQLAAHLDNQGIEYIQFSFRWMNCLLMRELSLPNIIRMWDSYLSEPLGTGFREFHIYVCAAFLNRWSKQLLSMEFQEIMVFLQSPPSKYWDDCGKEVEILLAEAFMWQELYKNATAHLKE